MYKIKATLPSGKIVYIPEINNGLYYDLHKHILNEDYEGFYNCLNEHIAHSCPEIYDLNLLDKFYIYITLYTYCIKAELELSSNIESFMQQNTYSLFDALENIQDIKINDLVLDLDTKIGNAKCVITVPSQLELIDNILTFNPLSGIKKININSQDYFIKSKEDKDTLALILTSDNYNKIINEILKNYNYTLKIIENKIELPLLSNFTFEYFAKSLYYSDMGYQMDLQYIFMRHLNVSPSEFKEMTPIDTNIFLLKFLKEKKEEQKAREETENSNNHRNALDL